MPMTASKYTQDIHSDNNPGIIIIYSYWIPLIRHTHFICLPNWEWEKDSYDYLSLVDNLALNRDVSFCFYLLNLASPRNITRDMCIRKLTWNMTSMQHGSEYGHKLCQWLPGRKRWWLIDLCLSSSHITHLGTNNVM